MLMVHERKSRLLHAKVAPGGMRERLGSQSAAGRPVGKAFPGREVRDAVHGIRVQGGTGDKSKICT